MQSHRGDPVPANGSLWLPTRSSRWADSVGGRALAVGGRGGDVAGSVRWPRHPLFSGEGPPHTPVGCRDRCTRDGTSVALCVS